jgi:hypothetical protein
MAFGDSISDALHRKLDPWLSNPPDYDDVSQTYKKRGLLNARRARLVREISRAEDDVVIDSSNPRSNSTRLMKLEATKQLRDELAELEAEIQINDSDVKLLEYRRDMYKVANYQLRNLDI